MSQISPDILQTIFKYTKPNELLCFLLQTHSISSTTHFVYDYNHHLTETNTIQNILHAFPLTTFKSIHLFGNSTFPLSPPHTNHISSLTMWNTDSPDLNFLQFLPKLHALDISGNPHLSNLSPISSCPQLQTLIMKWCCGRLNLSSLKLCPNLRTLDLHKCIIHDLDALQSCPNLRSLNISGCSNISSLSPLQFCPNLTTLNISKCIAITTLDHLQFCPSLTHLTMKFSAHRHYGAKSSKISDLSPLSSLILPNLHTLDISGLSSGPVQLPPLSHKLQHLDISNCIAITDISFLIPCHNLKSLCMMNCDNITNFHPLSSCRKLRTLSLPGCDDLSFLESHANLRTLVLCGCKNKISNINSLASCINLQTLKLLNCPQITTLAPLRSCTNLIYIHLNENNLVPDLEPLSECTKLKTLIITRYTNVSDLTPLASLKFLTRLDFSFNTKVSDMSPLLNCAKLQTLDLSGCTNILDITILNPIKSITSLTLNCFPNIQDLAFVTEFPQLITLNVSTSKIINLDKIVICTHLQYLDISYCQISDITPISKLTRLEILTMFECNNITDLSPLLACMELRHVYGCSKSNKDVLHALPHYER